jgi:hypothetical protein
MACAHAHVGGDTACARTPHPKSRGHATGVHADCYASNTVTNPQHHDALEREVMRLNARYLTEVVEGFGLCPWAQRARLEGRVEPRVFLHDSPEFLADSLLALEALAGRPELEIGLFIYPCLRLGRLPFEHFARRLRERDAERYPVGEVPFAMAAFHPDAEPDLGDPQRLVPYLRRTPYPTLQVVRMSALARVRAGDDGGTLFVDPAAVAAMTFDLATGAQAGAPTPPLRERIARANLATVERVGTAAVDAVVRDILRDRDETHARLERERECTSRGHGGA